MCNESRQRQTTKAGCDDYSQDSQGKDTIHELGTGQQRLDPEMRRIRAWHLVYEEVLATGVWGDETETFCCIEPCSKESTSEFYRSVALERRRRQP